MKDKGFLWILLGAGALYLLSKSRTSFVPQQYPVSTGVPTTYGSGGISNIISTLVKGFLPGVPGVSNIPMTPGGVYQGTTSGTATIPQGSLNCSPGGNVCDPNDCSYSDAVCQELYPQ